MAPEKICKNCVFWLASDRITDYGYCVKRDAYKPEFLTCDHFIVRAVLREEGGLKMADNKIQEEARLRYPKVIGRIIATGDLNDYRREAFIAGAEWQKQQDLAEMAQSESPLSVAYSNRCFENGKQAMKEQMLKDAVEGEVCKDRIVTEKPFYFYQSRLIELPDNLKEGDKVKIVIVKEDKK